MGDQALKLALEKNQRNLILAGALIVSITLSGIGLFGSGRASFVFGTIGVALLIPLSLLAISIQTYSCVNKHMKDKDNIKAKDIIGGIFCAAMFSGTLLMIEGLFGGLDSDMKFIVNIISFTLLLSSLLCFITHRGELIRDEYKLQCINSGLEDSESRSSGSGGKDSGLGY